MSTDDYPMESKELERLLLEKEALKERDDLSREDKKRMGRSLRRRIRNLKAAIGTGEHSEESEDIDLGEAKLLEKKERRRVRRQKRKAHEKGFEFLLKEEERNQYIVDLFDLLGEVLTFDEDAATTQLSIGYSGALVLHEAQLQGIYPKQMASLMIKKFSVRWQSKPKWYSTRYEGSNTIFCLGPIPQTN